MAENFPNLKETGYQGTGSTESSKYDKPKRIHTKTYYNKNGKI